MPREVYRHTQIGWICIWACAGIMALTVITGSAFQQPRTQFPTIAFTTAILALICIMFGSLTVVVEPGSVLVAFGPGLIRRRIPLDQVLECKPVRNKWTWGWGIRKIPNGWMFNVSGLEAVELVLRSGRTFRIGTDEPERLARVINEQLASIRQS